MTSRSSYEQSVVIVRVLCLKALHNIMAVMI